MLVIFNKIKKILKKIFTYNSLNTKQIISKDIFYNNKQRYYFILEIKSMLGFINEFIYLVIYLNQNKKVCNFNIRKMIKEFFIITDWEYQYIKREHYLKIKKENLKIKEKFLKNLKKIKKENSYLNIYKYLNNKMIINIYELKTIYLIKLNQNLQIKSNQEIQNNEKKNILDKYSFIKLIEKIKSDNIINYLYKNIYFYKDIYFLFNNIKIINIFEKDLLKPNYLNKNINEKILYKYFYQKKKKTVYNYLLYNNSQNFLYTEFKASYLMSQLFYNVKKAQMEKEERSFKYLNSNKKYYKGNTEQEREYNKNKKLINYRIFPLSEFDLYYFSIKSNKVLEKYLVELKEDIIFYEKKRINMERAHNGLNYDYSLLFDELFINLNNKKKSEIKNTLDIESLYNVFNIYLDIFMFAVFPEKIEFIYINEIFYPNTINILIIPTFYKMLQMNIKLINNKNDINNYLLKNNYEKINLDLWLLYTETLMENYYYKNLKKKTKELEIFDKVLNIMYDEYKNNYIIFDLKYDFFIQYNDLLRQLYLIDQDKIAYLSIEKNKFMKITEILDYKFERYYNSIILSEEFYNKKYNINEYYNAHGYESEIYYYDFEDIFEEYDILFLEVINTIQTKKRKYRSKAEKIASGEAVETEDEYTYLMSDINYLDVVNNFLMFNKMKIKIDDDNEIERPISLWYRSSLKRKIFFNSLGYDRDLFDYDSDYYSNQEITKESLFNYKAINMQKYLTFNTSQYNFFYLEYLLIFIFFSYYIYIIKMFMLDYILNNEYNKKVSEKYLFGPILFFKNRISVKYINYLNYSYEFLGTAKDAVKLFKSKKTFFLEKSNIKYIIKEKKNNIIEKAFDFTYFGQYKYGYVFQSFIFYPVYLYKVSLDIIKKFYKFGYNYGVHRRNLKASFRKYRHLRFLEVTFWYEYFLFDPITLGTRQDEMLFDHQFSDYANFYGEDLITVGSPLESLGFNGFLAEIDERFKYEYDYISPVLPFTSYINTSFNFLLRLNFLKDVLVLLFIRFFNFFYNDFFKLCIKGVNLLFCFFMNFYISIIYIICLFFYYLFLGVRYCLIFGYVYQVKLVKSIAANKQLTKISLIIIKVIYNFNLIIGIIADYFYYKIFNILKKIIFLVKIPTNFHIILLKILKLIFFLLKKILILIIKLLIIYFLLIYFFDHYDAIIYYFYNIFPFRISPRTYFLIYSILMLSCLMIFFYPSRISIFLWVKKYWIFIILIVLWGFAGMKNNEFFYLLPMFDKLYIEGQNIIYGYHFYKSYLINWLVREKRYLTISGERSYLTIDLLKYWNRRPFYQNAYDFGKNDLSRAYKGIRKIVYPYIKDYIPSTKNIKGTYENLIDLLFNESSPLALVKFFYNYYKESLFLKPLFLIKTFFGSYFDFLKFQNTYIEKISNYFYNIYLQSLYVDSVFFSGLYDLYIYGFNNNYILDKDKIWLDIISGGIFVSYGIRYLPLYTTTLYKNNKIPYTYIDELFLKNYIEKSEKYYRYNSAFIDSIVSKNIKKYKKHIDYDLLDIKTKKNYMKTFFKYKQDEYMHNDEEARYVPYPYHFGIRDPFYFKNQPYAYYSSRDWPIYSEYFYTSIYNNHLKYGNNYSFYFNETDFPKITKYVRPSLLYNKKYFIIPYPNKHYYFYIISPIRRLYRFNNIKSIYYYSQNNILQLKNLLEYNSNYDSLKYYLYINQSKLIDASDILINFASPMSVFKFNKRLLLAGFKDKNKILFFNNNLKYMLKQNNKIFQIKKNILKLIKRDILRYRTLKPQYFSDSSKTSFRSYKIRRKKILRKIYKKFNYFLNKNLRISYNEKIQTKKLRKIYQLYNLDLLQIFKLYSKKNKKLLNKNFYLLQKNLRKRLLYKNNNIFNLKQGFIYRYKGSISKLHKLKKLTKIIRGQKEIHLLNKKITPDNYYMWYYLMPVFLKKYEQRLYIKEKYTELMKKLEIKELTEMKNFYFPKTILSSFLLNLDLPFDPSFAGLQAYHWSDYLKRSAWVKKKYRLGYFLKKRKKNKVHKIIFRSNKTKHLRKIRKIYEYISYKDNDNIGIFIIFKNKVAFSYLDSLRYKRHLKDQFVSDELGWYDLYETGLSRQLMWDVFFEWNWNYRRFFEHWAFFTAPQYKTSLASALSFFTNPIGSYTHDDEYEYTWLEDYEEYDDNPVRLLFNMHKYNKLMIKNREFKALNEPRGMYNRKAFNKLLNNEYLNMSILNYININLKYGAMHDFNYKYYIYSYPEQVNLNNNLWFEKINYYYPKYIKYLYENRFKETLPKRILRTKQRIYKNYISYNKYKIYDFIYKYEKYKMYIKDKNDKQAEIEQLDTDKTKIIPFFSKIRLNYNDIKEYLQNPIINKKKYKIELENELKKIKLKEQYLNEDKKMKYYIEGEKQSKNILQDFNLILKKELNNYLLPFEIYNIKKKRSYNKYYKGSFINVWSTSTWKTKLLNKPFLKRYYFDINKMFNKNKFYSFRNIQSYYALVGEQINYRNQMDDKYINKKQEELNYHTMNKNRVYFSYLNSILYSLRSTMWGKIEPNLDHFFYFYRGNKDNLFFTTKKNKRRTKKYIEYAFRRSKQGILRFNRSYDAAFVKKSSLYKNNYNKLKINELNNKIMNEYKLQLDIENNLILKESVFDKNYFLKKREIEKKKKAKKKEYLKNLKLLKFRDFSDYDLKRKKFAKKKEEQIILRRLKLSRNSYKSYQYNDYFEQNLKRTKKKKVLLKRKGGIKEKRGYPPRKLHKSIIQGNKSLFYNRHRTRTYWYKFLVPDIGYYGSSFWGRDFQFMNYDVNSHRKTNYYKLVEQGSAIRYK